MGNNVFANGREVSCKAGSGKSICAFPDVCMTPPQTPATPPGVPIPYPNTGMASDMTSGSKKVNVSKKEVMLRNKSYFKCSIGDEAGSAPLKGVVTHKTKGKVYFNAWSMDVKIEGENVVRHLDSTTHNHGSGMNTPVWPHITKITSDAPDKPCKSSCPKKPNKERRDKLRNGSPSGPTKKRIKNKECKCVACKVNPGDIADHIVPLDKITQMPGFACLNYDNQYKLANYPDNFIGICGSCNSSKKNKLWHDWHGHGIRELKWDKRTKSKGIDVTNKLLVKLNQEIKDMACK